MTLDRFHSKDVQINEDLDFSSLVSNPALLKGLANAGYQRPSPIQLKTIPLGRLGLDLIAQAKSGTGKTIVFSVIAIEAVLSTISNNSRIGAGDLQHPKAIIVAPTREIAVQIQNVILNLIHEELGQSVACYSMIGGMSLQKDRDNAKRCSIVVGTPGRLRWLISAGDLNTSQVRLLVLDEADKLMEDVFKEDVFEISGKLGPNKQVMAFSATYDDDLLSQLDQLVKNPVYVMLSNGTPELEGVLQYYKVATLDEKHKDSSVFLRQMHIMEAKFAELESLLTHVPFYQAIVFLNHRGRAADLVKFLTRNGWPAMHIASGISQEERLKVMKKARNFELRILVCSDLIARGIDIDRVNLVVNLDLPKDPETYLHRVGRTGRYGTTGLAVSIVDSAELKTVEILRQDFSITIEKLSEEDMDYRELNSSSKKRHHERPLQEPSDLKQFKKLEAERTVSEKRARENDEASQLSSSDGYTDKRNKSTNASSHGKQGVTSKKNRKRTQARHSLMTPEMTPPMTDLQTGNTLVSHSAEDVEGAGAESDTSDISPEIPGHGLDSTFQQESAYPYYQYYGYELFYPNMPGTTSSALPFPSLHPLREYYPPLYAANPYHIYRQSVQYPTVAPRSLPIFFPPDLPLSSHGLSSFTHFR
ncbi:P-loop containing nucleoside triphosphate hydrolase protein [Gamsiella multidivaricata]|uniref:P-loop containing nucleoside triphosphate hydrolase protein n=1 Tax=Gamsiella multidivaricata TaxID=101098 RepID=UPI0022210173|nr:P-loop containing nucleoside triphosphate hydrolase protein [Gamsiella multidivaricata]KAG0369267.1 DEAD (Asp-Glu-Ala-Asp) box polypeptide 20 [Gamsiella multidivaricata]KAI7820963.1 P-loop containing nucleoside triphosphate hydrolase protein [Gamsiella multidivaricata]